MLNVFDNQATHCTLKCGVRGPTVNTSVSEELLFLFASQPDPSASKVCRSKDRNGFRIWPSQRCQLRMASKDHYKMPTQVLPILGTRDDIFPRADSIYYLVSVQHPPQLVPAGLSGAAVVLTNKNGTSLGIPSTDSIHIPLRTFVGDGQHSSLPWLFI